MNTLQTIQPYAACPVCGSIVLQGAERCPTAGASIPKVLEAWTEAQSFTRWIAVAVWGSAILALPVLAVIGVRR